jgi:hypothetical protein
VTVLFQTRRNFLLSTGALTLGCASARKPAGQTVAVIKTLATPLHQPTITAYPNLNQAVAAIVKQQPTLIAFGEIHKLAPNPIVSTSRRFADTLPLLADAGYRDLIIEFLPFGENGKKEVVEYLQTRTLGPLLSDYIIGHPDEEGIMAILLQARKLKIKGQEFNLHGIHAQNRQEYEQANQSNNPSISQLINERMLSTINSLAGRRIITYTGAHHNNLVPLPDKENFSNGKALRRILGDNYVEVDLYLPELIATVQTIYLSLEHLDLPSSGLNSIRYPNGRYVILFAYTDK